MRISYVALNIKFLKTGTSENFYWKGALMYPNKNSYMKLSVVEGTLVFEKLIYVLQRPHGAMRYRNFCNTHA